jgi:ABC-type branched-subunit amino acid transport system substrate-binding protein
MRSMRRFRALSALAIAVAVLAACGGSAPTTSQGPSGPLIISAFSPFTGTDPGYGPEQAAGCWAAAKTVNDAGGVLGHKLECINTDSKGDPADAIPAVEQLLATTPNLVGMVGPSSDEASATVPIINRQGIPMDAATGQGIFDTTTDKYFWRITPPDDANGYAMAVYAAKKGYTRAALVFGTDIASQGATPTLISGFQKLGGTVVINEKISLDQASYQTEVSRLLAAQPQVIFMETDPQSASTYLKNLLQIHGGLLPIIGTGATTDPPFIQAVEGAIGVTALEQYFVSATPSAPTSGPAWTTYNTALLASAAKVPMPSQWSQDPFSMAAYDGVVMYALAMNAAHSTDPHVFNSDILGVTTAMNGAVVVNSYADGLRALKAGKHIQYLGATGPIVFDQHHNSPGEFDVVRYTSPTQQQILVTILPQQIAQLK